MISSGKAHSSIALIRRIALIEIVLGKVAAVFKHLGRQAQLQHARLDRFFEAILSVDEVRRFKPAPAPYRMAAQRMQVGVSALRMVAAHDWDIIGAMAAGCRGAFVARGGTAFPAWAPRPDVCEPGLDGVAEAIIRADG